MTHTERYDYREAMAEDIYDYLCENGIDGSEYADRDDAFEKLNDALWVEDSVTGNASGSYTMDRDTAKRYVFDNWDLVMDAYRELGEFDKLVEAMESSNFEYMDVLVRCYLLGEVLYSVLEDLEAEAQQGRSEWGYYDESEVECNA